MNASVTPPKAPRNDTTSTACPHAGSNHRLAPAFDGLLWARNPDGSQTFKPRQQRALRAIALAGGGAPVQLDAAALRARTFASRRTNYRAVRELIAAGVILHWPIYSTGPTGRPRRHAPVYQLAEPFRTIATRKAPTSTEIRARALERVMLARELLGRAPARPRGPSRALAASALSCGAADPSSSGSSRISPSCSSGILALTPVSAPSTGPPACPSCRRAPCACVCASCYGPLGACYCR